MKKTTFAVFAVSLLLFSMSLTSAYEIQKVVRYNTDPISSDNFVTSSSTPTPSSNTPVTTSSKTSNGKGAILLTKWGWDGKECVKRDIYSRPFLSKKDSKFNSNYVIVGDEIKGGYVWRVRVISGNFGIVRKDSGYGLQREPNCDTSQTNVEPLSLGWYRN